jgi:hypothetical protein
VSSSDEKKKSGQKFGGKTSLKSIIRRARRRREDNIQIDFWKEDYADVKAVQLYQYHGPVLDVGINGVETSGSVTRGFIYICY